MSEALSQWKEELEQQVEKIGIEIKVNDEVREELLEKIKVLERVLFINSHYEHFDVEQFKKDLDYDFIKSKFEEIDSNILKSQRALTMKIHNYNAVIEAINKNR